MLSSPEAEKRAVGLCEDGDDDVAGEHRHCCLLSGDDGDDDVEDKEDIKKEHLPHESRIVSSSIIIVITIKKNLVRVHSSQKSRMASITWLGIIVPIIITIIVITIIVIFIIVITLKPPGKSAFLHLSGAAPVETTGGIKRHLQIVTCLGALCGENENNDYGDWW